MAANCNPNHNPNEVNSMLAKSPNWVELPCDVTLIILSKLRASEILESAQFVCKLWYDLCKDPSLWRSINLRNNGELELLIKYEKMMFNAVDRSDGGLIDLDIEGFGSDHLFSYIVSRSSQLKRLRIACCPDISFKVMAKVVGELTSLVDLELTLSTLQQKTTIHVINACSFLTTFKLNKMGPRKPYHPSDEEAMAIATSMPKLRHLQLIGNNLTSHGLSAILDACSHLQSLDLRMCFYLNLFGDFDKRLLSGQINNVWGPDDTIEDYELPSNRNW